MPKRVKRYIITFDADGEEVVWIQHGDYTVRLSPLFPNDIADSDTFAIDLRNPDFRS